MARVTLDIGGTHWTVNTRDGGEAEVRRLGQIVAERWPQALRAAGDGGVPQALILTALMLADELSETQAQATTLADQLRDTQAQARDQAERHVAERADTALLDDVAAHLESLAEALERSAPND